MTARPVRLFELFAGAHFTLLGFGTEATGALREAASRYGDALRVCAVDAGGEGVVDDQGHIAAAYGAAAGESVLVRPDGHVGLTAPASRADAVSDHLVALDGLGR